MYHHQQQQQTNWSTYYHQQQQQTDWSTPISNNKRTGLPPSATTNELVYPHQQQQQMDWSATTISNNNKWTGLPPPSATTTNGLVYVPPSATTTTNAMQQVQTCCYKLSLSILSFNSCQRHTPISSSISQENNLTKITAMIYKITTNMQLYQLGCQLQPSNPIQQQHAAL